MQFLLNTAVDPHFCALFDEHGQLFQYQEWTDRKQDGREIFAFLEKIQSKKTSPQDSQDFFTFLGGVSGPGGFSSLRAGSGILNALSFASRNSVYQVRADKWIRAFLDDRGYRETPFVLNSFSSGVFLCDQGKLLRMPVSEAAQKYENTEIFVGMLPDSKAQFFSRKLSLPWKNTAGILLQVLKKESSQKYFLPDYEFPPL